MEIHSLCLVVNIENSNAFDAMKETFVALANEIYKQLDVQLKVSLSSGCRKLDMVHDAYLEAHAVQQYHLFYGAKQVAFYTSENLVSGPGALFDAETRHTLMMLLRKRDERAIRKFIDDQLDSILAEKDRAGRHIPVCGRDDVRHIRIYFPRGSGIPEKGSPRKTVILRCFP